MTSPGRHELFVYGTLRHGQERFRLIAPVVAGLRAGRTRGRLFHLPFGYPVLVEAETGWVHGELFRFREPMEEVLAVCDGIEGYEPDDEAASLFIRVVTEVEPAEVEPVEAWCYCLGPTWRDALLRWSHEIPDGDWLAFRRRKRT
ncbi:MAG: gamma-glutamylcyclotransferase [Candidatus Tectimicrobiota bacterium]